MKIYFDTCALNRPLDDRGPLRVNLEAEAVLGILALCEAGKHELVSSDALQLEVEQNPLSQRRAFVESILERALHVVEVTDDIGARAKGLETHGFKAFDALHVACAEFAEVNYLCTCDDRLLKKSRRQTELKVKVISPLDLAGELSE